MEFPQQQTWDALEYRKHYRPFPQVHSVLQHDFSTFSTLETIATLQRVGVAATGLTLMIPRLSGEQAGLGRRPTRG